MRLTLHYRGNLRSNGTPLHKHELRQHFHKQLRTLWTQIPLKDEAQYWLQPRTQSNYCLLRPLNGFTFVPLITAEMNVVAELSVTILRPESPGNLITQGGDIDNRLKTLFDALTMPRLPNALPAAAVPNMDESPYFYCLLEDDNLITAVSVRTEQLLEPCNDQSLVEVLIQVHTSVTRATMGNSTFG
jgi:hypothetical protein